MPFRLYAVVTALAAATVFAHAADSTSDTMQMLRELGARVAITSDALAKGNAPSARTMQELNRALSVYRSELPAAADPRLIHKFQSIQLAFDVLKRNAALHVPAIVPPGRNRTALEVVSGDHGGRCDSALYFPGSDSVRVTLAASATAWFALTSPQNATFAISSRSAGPDPMLEVFDGCDANASIVASNDDTFGLDARALVETRGGRPRYVKLTNNGKGGTIVVQAVTANMSVSGTITDLKTHQPLTSAQVALVPSQQQGVSDWVSTDQNGNYSIPAGAGTYYVAAASYLNLTELYPTAFCPPNTPINNVYGCDFDHAQTVTVTATNSPANVDIALSEGQQVYGTVRDANNVPIQNAFAQLFDASGSNLSTAITDHVGHYNFGALSPGTYRVEASSFHTGSQLYDHVTCAGPLQTVCDLNQGLPLTLTSQDIGDVDFNLPIQSAIAGQVALDGGGSTSATFVDVINTDGSGVLRAGINVDGSYAAGPLALGTYYVYAESVGHFSQLFPQHDCGPDCASEITNGTPLTVSYPGQQVPANFELHPLPALSGHVQDAVTGAPLANVKVSVQGLPLNTTIAFIYAITTAAGDYTIPFVPAGTWYVWAQSDDHVDQLYQNVTCEEFNGSVDGSHCNIASATPLTIAPGSTSPVLDFALPPSASVRGRAITRAGNGSDLPAQLYIELFDPAGNLDAFVSSDTNGNYLLADLAPGTYYAMAVTEFTGSFVSQIWNGMDCTSICTPSSGTPIVLSAGTQASDIDFQLVRKDGIVGRITDHNGIPIRGVVVDTFSSTSQNYLLSGVSDAEGFYEVDAPPGSSYYLATEAGGLYVDQIYAGITCPLGSVYAQKCAFTGATPITVPQSATSPLNFDFVLEPKDRLFQSGFE